MFPVQQKTTLEKYNLSMRLEKVANNCLLIANCVHNIFVLQAELTELSEYYLQIYLRYVVLNFIEQNEVEVAPSSWLEWIDGVLFCYWPNSNVGTKVKKCAIRDEHLWTKYAVRVFSDTDNYNLARYRVQKAMETSHVEDSDENSVRKIIPPRRFREEEIQPRRAQHFQEDSESSQDELSSLRAKKTQKRSRSTPIRSESEEPDEDEVQPITKITKRSILPEAPRFSSPSSQLQPHQSISANFQNQGSVNDPQSLRDEIYKLFENLERRIILKLDAIEENITSAFRMQNMRQPSTSVSDLTEVLEEPCETVEELEELCEKLKDADLRKKMIRYLCLQSGGTLGDGIRRMLKKIGDNSLWTHYSYKGRKGKLKFQQLLINDVIIRACSKAYPHQKSQSVEEMIAVTLKHAPDRAKTANQVRSQQEGFPSE
ncbi:uncharacterized protein LOC120486323 isoform X3 [Pimephales promelas]|uniref:uncharacterized protein LOC120486323 isoform X3 n=1 Tax=Pimephales promelas TaxID=90988 RepID=UPI001955AF7F|nr:uncharacterized protein LOC120486323 isoform X3 [Pimephales promelas]